MDSPRFGIRLSAGRGVVGFREPLHIPLGEGSNVVGENEIRLSEFAIAVCPVATDAELLGWYLRVGAELVAAQLRKLGVEGVDLVELPSLDRKRRGRRRAA